MREPIPGSAHRNGYEDRSRQARYGDSVPKKPPVSGTPVRDAALRTVCPGGESARECPCRIRPSGRLPEDPGDWGASGIRTALAARGSPGWPWTSTTGFGQSFGDRWNRGCSALHDPGYGMSPDCSWPSPVREKADTAGSWKSGSPDASRKASGRRACEFVSTDPPLLNLVAMHRDRVPPVGSAPHGCQPPRVRVAADPAGGGDVDRIRPTGASGIFRSVFLRKFRPFDTFSWSLLQYSPT